MERQVPPGKLIIGGTAMTWDRSIGLQADPGGLVYRGFAVNAEAIDPFAGVILRKSLIAYFVHRSVNDGSLVERLRRNAEVHRAKWKSWHDAPSKRLSMKVTPRVGDEFDELVKKSALNKTTLVKSIVMDIGSEIVEPEEPRMMPELRRMAAALAA